MDIYFKNRLFFNNNIEDIKFTNVKIISSIFIQLILFIYILSLNVCIFIKQPKFYYML